MNISKNMKIGFREAMTGLVLREITNIFDGADVACNFDYVPPVTISGDRRTLIERFYSTIRWENPTDVAKILKAFGDYLAYLEAESADPVRSQQLRESARSCFERLIALSRREGFKYLDGRLLPVETAIMHELAVPQNRWLGDVSNVSKDPKLVSLMTPFDARFEPVNKVLREVCSGEGYKLEHVANNPKSDFIIHKIAQLIYSSRLVVFNITRHNPNVMYELGLAHAMNKDIQIISEDVSGIPFDFSHVAVLHYLPNDEGLRKLAQEFKLALNR